MYFIQYVYIAAGQRVIAGQTRIRWSNHTIIETGDTCGLLIKYTRLETRGLEQGLHSIVRAISC